MTSSWSFILQLLGIYLLGVDFSGGLSLCTCGNVLENALLRYAEYAAHKSIG